MDQGDRSNDHVVHLPTPSTDSGSSNSTRWNVFGQRLPRSEIVFFVQVILVFTVVIVSLWNITRKHPDSQLWIALLSSSVGYLLPSPTLNSKNG